VSRTGATIASTAKETAAALKGFSQNPPYVAAAGLNSIATLATRGAMAANRIATGRENDGDGAPLLQQRGRGGCGVRKNEVGL
jgi:hypothetical protein